MPNFVHTKVNPEKLISVSSNINENIIQVEKAIKTIRQTLNEGGGGSLKGTWTGPASSQFYEQYAADAELIDSVLEALQTLNDQLKEAASIFDSADNRALELVRKLKIGEGG